MTVEQDDRGQRSDVEELIETVSSLEGLDPMDRERFQEYLDAETALENRLLAEAERLVRGCEHDSSIEVLDLVIELNNTMRDIAERERARRAAGSDDEAYFAQWRDAAAGVLLLAEGQKQLTLAERNRIQGDLETGGVLIMRAVGYFEQLADSDYPQAPIGHLRIRLARALNELYEALADSRIGNYRGAHDRLDLVHVFYEELLAESAEGLRDADAEGLTDGPQRAILTALTAELNSSLIDIRALQAVVDMMIAGLAGRFTDMIELGSEALASFEASTKAVAAASGSRNVVALRRMEMDHIAAWIGLARAEVAADNGEWETVRAAVRSARRHLADVSRLAMRNLQVGLTGQRPDVSNFEFLLTAVERRANRERRLRDANEELRGSLHRSQLSSINVINNAQANAEATGERVTMGDSHQFHAPVHVTGALGSSNDVTVGPVQQHHTTTTTGGGTDLRALADELASLREVLAAGPRTERERASIEQVRLAEEAARTGDEQGVRGHLAAAGRWALEVAETVGVQLAIAALRTSVGV